MDKTNFNAKAEEYLAQGEKKLRGIINILTSFPYIFLFRWWFLV